MKINAEWLVESLGSHACAFNALSPRQMPKAVIDRCIENLRRRRIVLDSEDQDHRALANSVAGPLALASVSARAKLGECEIYLLPFPLCIAYSTRCENRNLIVIGSGMLDLVETVACSAHVIGSLPEEAQRIYPVSELAGMSLADIFSQFIFVLLFRFVYKDEFLPNIQGLASAQMIHDARVSAAGGAAFVLLHELAHLELHHAAKPVAPSIDIASSIPESLSQRQRQEHEADQAAIGYLESEWQEIGHFWRNCAFDFFVRLELMSGVFSETHPLALNRIFHLDEMMRSGSGFYDFAQRKNVNAILANGFSATLSSSAYSPDHMLNISRDTCLAILARIRQPLLQAGGPDIAPLLNGPGPSWKENFLQKGIAWEADDSSGGSDGH